MRRGNTIIKTMLKGEKKNNKDEKIDVCKLGGMEWTKRE